MITLQQLEEKYNFIFPDDYKTLWDNGMLNYMRGFDNGLKEGENWVDTVYPTLKENPPVLLHSGESQLTMMTPEMMLNFDTPPFWDTDTHHFIPFAKTLEGNYFAYYDTVRIDGQTPVVEIWDEMDDTEFFAKNFEDFIVRQMLESANDIDKDDLKAEYNGDVDAYLTDVHNDIKSVSPYLKQSYVNLLNEIYGREPKEGTLSYALLDMRELESLIKKYLDFEKMGESFSHEL